MLRQLLWHRHRMVPARTRIMNQLQAVALNEGLRSKKRLWREAGREQLAAIRLAPWASRRRQDLLELLDRLNPTVAELTEAVEQEAEKCPEARRLMTHPGVGPLTALAFVLVIGTAERFRCGKQIASYLGLAPVGGLQWGASTAGTYQQTRELSAAFPVGGSRASHGAQQPGMALQVFPLGDAPRTEDRQRQYLAPPSVLRLLASCACFGKTRDSSYQPDRSGWRAPPAFGKHPVHHFRAGGAGLCLAAPGVTRQQFHWDWTGRSLLECRSHMRLAARRGVFVESRLVLPREELLSQSARPS